MKTAPRGEPPYGLEDHALKLFKARVGWLRKHRRALDDGEDRAFYYLKTALKRLFPGASLVIYDEDAREFVIVKHHSYLDGATRKMRTDTKVYRYA